MQFNESEEYLKDYLYDGYLSTFIHLEIGRKLNISFDEFINRPRYEINAITNMIDKIDKTKSTITDKALSELESKVPKVG